MLFSKNRTHSQVYRKIYEQHFGPIPKDEDGRTFEIHHIDGDDSNNDPSNLIAVSIIEHYNIHFSQGDWSACLAMTDRMSVSPDTKSMLSSMANEQRVKDGTHNFLAHRNPSHRRVKDGTHNFLDKENAKKRARKLISDGTHHFLDNNPVHKMIASGTHTSQIKTTCDHCGRIFSLNMYKAYHGDKCKLRRE